MFNMTVCSGVQWAWFLAACVLRGPPQARYAGCQAGYDPSAISVSARGSVSFVHASHSFVSHYQVLPRGANLIGCRLARSFISKVTSAQGGSQYCKNRGTRLAIRHGETIRNTHVLCLSLSACVCLLCY